MSYLGSWIVGADSSTVLNVPAPGPGPIGPRRPVPQLSNITAIRWDGYSMFHGLTLKAQQRLSSGLSFSASYMLSKAIDDASDPGATVSETNLPQDVRNLDAERATASFDHRHRFVGNVTYALPSGWRAAVVGPGYADADLVIGKDVVLASGARLEFRWEIFNLLNRANFDVPNRIACTPNFGRVFSAGPARQMQLRIKVRF